MDSLAQADIYARCGEWAPEMLGIDDPLTEVWEELGL